MTEMLDMSPLSPARECAMSRSSISVLLEMDSRRDQFARQQRRQYGDDFARRFGGAAAAGRAAGVERFDFVADAYGFAPAGGSACDADAHFVGFVGDGRELCAVDGVDADQVVAHFVDLHAGHGESLPDDVQRQLATRLRAGAGVGDLAFADVAIDVAEGGLERGGTCAAIAPADG